MAEPKRDLGIPFPTTQLPKIDLLSSEDPARRREGWEWIYLKYWKPLYVYLRRKGKTVARAKELLQEFFLRCGEGQILKTYDPTKGRLRHWMMACLLNLDREENRHARAQVDYAAIPLIDDAATVGCEEALARKPGADPETEFEDEWPKHIYWTAVMVIFQRLKKEDPIDFRVFTEWLAKEENERGDAEEFAKAIGLPTAGALYQRVRRLRGDLRREVAMQVRRTSAPDADIEGEVQGIYLTMFGTFDERDEEAQPMEEQQERKEEEKGG